MLALYFDESGNTRTNYLDVRQPYFVYGGWLIEEEKEDEICESIKRIFGGSRAKELKSKKGLKYKKVKELLDILIFEFNVIPVFGVADSVSKNDNLLVAISKIIHNGTIELEKMRSIKMVLSNHFKNENLFEVQRTISELSDENLQEMIKEFEDVSKNGIEKRRLTLVEPILIDRILNVDIYARTIGEQVNLYVDELWGYQNIFEELREILNKKTIITNVKFVKQCKSDDSLLIQAADLLCGFIFNTLMKIEVLMKNEIVNTIWQDFIIIGETLKKNNIKIWDYYAHSDFEYEILRLVGYEGPKKKVDCNQIIRRDFSKALK